MPSASVPLSAISLYPDSGKTLWNNLSLKNFDEKYEFSGESDSFNQKVEIEIKYFAKAFNQKKLGDSNDYEFIIETFKKFGTSNDSLSLEKKRQWIVSLTHNISHLDTSFRPLVKTVLGIVWIIFDENTLHTFIIFIRTLISTHSCYSVEALNMAAEIQGSLHEVEDMEDEMEFFNLNYNPGDITKKSKNNKDEIPKKENNQDDNVDEKNTFPDSENLFDMELDEESDDNESENDLDLDLEESEEARYDVQDLMEKLDCMIKLLLDFFNWNFKISLSKREYLEGTFQDLMKIFSNTILSTFKSRYTQFLIFWHVSLDRQFLEQFLTALYSNLWSESHPQGEKISSALYLGSLVARANFMDEAAVLSSVKILMNCGWQQIFRFENNVNYPDPEKYGVMYSIIQALMYIFCFRWKDLIIRKEGETLEQMIYRLKRSSKTKNSEKNWCEEIRGLERLIASKFEPLKICSQGIVRQFARISNSLNFMYCYALMTNGQQLIIPSRMIHDQDYNNYHEDDNGNGKYEGNDIGGGKGDDDDDNDKLPTRLDQFTFFPFDPFRLKTSSCYLKTIYREWEELPFIDNLEFIPNNNTISPHETSYSQMEE
ncbi:4470_t:CDS:2 [Ambispora gerdemannii]|uniref:4470_t:CDS:1 n=1 Tax=Ambispora gerdemannii TaxID=144530 RepID=A0A9N8W0V6_9GLOM|nr:4470_t:CDS:2 [Ambispora gerdemannii]